MQINKVKIWLLVTITIPFLGLAQNNRTIEHNQIGWYTAFATIKTAKKISVLPEFQWRRDNVITDPQQNLYRLGLQYEANPTIWLRVGYAFIETFNYGTYPINKFGKDFPEHRVYGGFVTNTKLDGGIDQQGRLIYEARWLGTFNDSTSNKVDSWTFVNRMRYMLRFQIPLKGNSIDDKEPYLAVYDEIMIGFGKNVNRNVFDQNRIGLLIGYKFNSQFKLEGGYLNQTVMLGRPDANSKNILQINQGIIVNAVFNLSMVRD